MCGIVGTRVLEESALPVRHRDLERMRDAMAHRGPDGAGLWVSRDLMVGLAHRRLAILDMSDSAAQPMSNEDGSLWIVFNGEIYNHASIRAELEKAGRHCWKTDHSDTEVILHAFEEWGIECLERFRGMFAFALWDARKRELWLVRDRIGIKPLYYSIHGGRISFASEIKALLEDPAQGRQVDLEAVYHYLSFLTSPAPRTLFRGIQKLPAGTWLCVRRDGSYEQRKYWDVWDRTTPLIGVSEDEIAERLVAELRNAVRLRKVSDVPVGVFLSGGIDSSTNAVLFSEGEDRPIQTFSIGYDGEYDSYKNELNYARLIARRVGAEHHERLLQEADLTSFLPEMIRLQDEPIGDPVCVPVYYVSQLARANGVIVCQVGEGADELFCGYPSWKIKHVLQRLNSLPVPGLLKQSGLFALRSLGQGERLTCELLQRGAAGVPVFWGGAEVFTEAGKRQLLSAEVNRSLAGLCSWDVLRPIRQRFEEKAWEPSILNWMSYLDLSLRLPELLLMRVDKMSMGVSLEGRVPFLDHRFVEFALSIPEAIRFKGGNLKYILKRAVRGLIPDEVIDRKKQGFGVPVHEWLCGNLGRLTESAVREFNEATGLFDRAAVEKVLAEKRSAHLWSLLNLALWWKHYIARNPMGSSDLLPTAVANFVDGEEGKSLIAAR